MSTLDVLECWLHGPIVLVLQEKCIQFQMGNKLQDPGPKRAGKCCFRHSAV